jgi:L-2-hydroxyglutarate oxidase LhgO
MDKVECVVIGAGVIGLAVARRLAQAGREVIVLEAAEGIGTVTSSRNSEVIHAGIYYPASVPCMNIAVITASRIAIAAS